MSERKPPLSLSVEIETSDGDSYDLGPWSPATDRPLDPAMGSQRGDGFADGSYSLARNIWRDYSDVGLYDTHRFLGVDGEVAYEGRLQSEPRSIGDDGHRIALQLQGWMTHARDRPATFLGVDNDYSKWTPPSVQRKLNLIGSGFGIPNDPTVDNDDATGAPAVGLGFDGSWTTIPICEALYDAGHGGLIGSIEGSWRKSSSVDNTNAAWVWQVGLADTDLLGSSDQSGNLRAAGPGTYLVNSTGGKRYAFLQLDYTSAGGVSGTHYGIFFAPSVFGDHGLSKILDASTGRNGLAASDMIRHIVGRFARKLSTGGVEQTSYPVKQAAWLDPTDPYDMLVQLNDLHLYELNVFEGATLNFAPADLSTVDWEVRAGEEGTKVSLDGDAAGPNGVIVVFTDYTGAKQTIYPSDYPGQLLDPNIENPATKHGIDAWGDPVEIPYACDTAYAVEVGRAVLAERLLPKSPGTITVQGHIRDAQGNWQQGWKPRCSQTVAIANAPNDRARLITEARWDPVNEVATLTLEQPSNRIEGLFNRTTTALRAANLSS